ncbi:MAG: efflux RND transporter periplasmic adaptor subunit [Acidobacteriota bacterium]
MNKKVQKRKFSEFNLFRRNKVKQNLLIKLILPALLTVFISACNVPLQDEEGEAALGGAAPVKVTEVMRQKISEKVYCTGLIEAREKIVITPETGGKIAKIYVDEGERVQRGDILAELETKTTRLQLKQAEAGLAVAKANYNDAQRNMERMERLRKENAVSEQQYEKVKLAFESSEAQLKQAQAALDLAEHNLDVSIMKAPFNGVIASKNAEVGDIINPMMGGGGLYTTSSGVLTLVDFSSVKIHIQVSHEDMVRIRKGQKAHITVKAFPERVFSGEVTVVNMTADPVSKKFNVEVQAQNSDLLLRPNIFGEVVLEVSTHEDALVIPQDAVVEGSYVFVAEGDKAVKRKITIGLQDTTHLEALQGLQEGERVIIEGNYGLEDGSLIEISGAKK